MVAETIFNEVNGRCFFDICRPKIFFACPHSIDMLARIAADMGMTTKFVGYEKHPKYPSLSEIMSQQTQTEVDDFRHVEPENPGKEVGIMHFSSGTTGISKGTIISYHSIVNHRMKCCDIVGGLNMLWYSSLSWITGTVFLTVCLLLRCKRVIHKEFDPEETSRVMEKYKVNWIFLTPTMLAQCYKANVFDRYDYSNMKTIWVGGSKVSKTVMETCQKHLPRIFVGNCFGWVHSGDLAYYNENGEITIIYLIKSVIITQNHHISPSGVEEILLRHPDVADCAVVPVPHSIDVERPLAFVVKSRDGKVTAEELMELPVSHNKYYRLIGGVVFVDELEFTSTNKNFSKMKEMAKVYVR